jgi:hypothetical protein
MIGAPARTAPNRPIMAASWLVVVRVSAPLWSRLASSGPSSSAAPTRYPSRASCGAEPLGHLPSAAVPRLTPCRLR